MKNSLLVPLLVGIIVFNIFLIKPTNAQTPISGTLSDTLTLAQSPYIVVGDISVDALTTLVIEAGVIITFQSPGMDMFIRGTLIASGTAGQTITFTSDEATPAPGDWGKIRFNGSDGEGFGTLSYCNFYYGGSANASNRMIESTGGAFITMTNCVVDTSTTGVFVNSTDSISIVNCSFSNNAVYGIDISTGSALSDIVSSVFTGNGEYGIRLLGLTGSYPDMTGSTFFGNGLGEVIINGTFNSDGAWVADHHVFDDLEIMTDATINLDSGITVTFENPNTDIFVMGTFNGNGVDGYPIIFTSDEAVPAPGDWGMLRFNGSGGNVGVGTLNYCDFSFGGNTASGLGMIVIVGGGYATLTSCSILDSEGDGVRVGVSSDALLSPNNSISGNQGFGVNNTNTSVIVNAENNWWGDASGPYDNSDLDGQGLLNPGGLGDAVSEYVDWSPFRIIPPVGIEDNPWFTIPQNFALEQNYPNPFNPATTIKYALPFESKVKIVLYSSLGERITELVNELQSVGYQQAVWNASNVASGVYIYTIEAVPTNGANHFSSIKKMILLR